MKVAIASETTGYFMKETVKAHLAGLGYEMIDVGATSDNDGTLYYEAAERLGRLVDTGEAECGVVICGTGGGVSLVCNAFRNVRAIACESVYTAERIKYINNANVLAMGVQVVGPTMACEMAAKFLAGDWMCDFVPQRKVNNQNGFDKIGQIKDEWGK